MYFLLSPISVLSTMERVPYDPNFRLPLSSWSFYRAGIADFIATFLFVYITVLTVMGVSKSPSKCASVRIQGIAWAFGGMIFWFLSPLSVVPLVALAGFGLYEFGFPGYLSHIVRPGKNIFDRFAILFSVVIVWIYAHLLTVGGAYNGKAPHTQTSCRTDRAGLIGGAPWEVLPLEYAVYHQSKPMDENGMAGNILHMYTIWGCNRLCLWWTGWKTFELACCILMLPFCYFRFCDETIADERIFSCWIKKSFGIHRDSCLKSRRFFTAPWLHGF